MSKKNSYGQYCPLAMSAEILCNRWTMLIIREFLDGSTGFNQLIRGLPLISRTLLSNRLKELERAGIITRMSLGGSKRLEYKLTKAGKALGQVVSAMAGWGQEWIDVAPSVQNIDVDFLMWDMRRNVKHTANLPTLFTAQFYFDDAVDKKQNHWLVFNQGNVELCYFDPGHDIDVYISSDLISFTKVWMGWADYEVAIESQLIRIDGLDKYVTTAKDWLGLSSLSHIKKQAIQERVLRVN